MTGALIVFARQPCAGKVKTRLAANLGAAAAADIYAQLLSRALLIAEGSRFVARYLFAADDKQNEYFDRRLDPGCWQVRAQCTGDIGQRMHQATAAILCRHDFVVLMGSDVADGMVSDLDEAWSTLASESAPAVIGPSVDGGYWLIGLRAPQPAIFNEIPWSTGDVLAATLARMATIGLEVKCLSPRHDIDTLQDLRYMA